MILRHRRRHPDPGFTLPEVMISVVLIAMVMSVIVAAISVTLRTLPSVLGSTHPRRLEGAATVGDARDDRPDRDPRRRQRRRFHESGNYYFENVTFEVKNAAVTAGWPEFAENGDQVFLPNSPCDDAMTADRLGGSEPGATFYLGGTSNIVMRSQGTLEIMRRRQGGGVWSACRRSTRRSCRINWPARWGTTARSCTPNPATISTW